MRLGALFTCDVSRKRTMESACCTHVTEQKMSMFMAWRGCCMPKAQMASTAVSYWSVRSLNRSA